MNVSGVIGVSPPIDTPLSGGTKGARSERQKKMKIDEGVHQGASKKSEVKCHGGVRSTKYRRRGV